MRFILPKSMVEYVSSDSTVRQAVGKMKFHRYAAIPVIDEDGRYVGTLRNDDILRCFLLDEEFDFKAAEKMSILDVMDTSYAKPVYHSASMEVLIECVKEHNFVPVVDDRGCFVGIILRRDILNYLLKFYNENDRGKK